MNDCRFGGSANGDLPVSVGPSTGEYTDVASANLGVRGTFNEESDDELESVRRTVTMGTGRFLSSFPELCERACLLRSIVVMTYGLTTCLCTIDIRFDGFRVTMPRMKSCDPDEPAACIRETERQQHNCSMAATRVWQE